MRLNKYLTYTAFAFCLASATSFVGCSDYDVPEGWGKDQLSEEFVLTLTIGTGSDHNSRALHRIKPEGGEDGDGRELGQRKENDIENLVLYYYSDPAGINANDAPITKILYKDDVAYHPDITGKPTDTELLKYELKFSAAETHYDFHAGDHFVVVANMGETLNPTTLGNTRFFVGKYFTTTSTKKELLPMETFRSDFENTAVTDNVGIPMTSINGQSVTVTERVNQTFGIEVRRLFAKLQFEYSYPMEVGSPKLLLKSQAVHNLTVNNDPSKPLVKLMNYEGLIATEDRTGEIDLPSPYTFERLTHTYPTPVPLVADGATAAVQKTQCFYVLESKAEAVTDKFELEFGIEKESGGTLEEDKMRYGLTKPEIITRIHRNDWVIIPIKIGEWVMDVEPYCYPPIGGYPDAFVDRDSKTHFHVTFKSPGDISLLLNIRKFYDPSSKFYLTDFDHFVIDAGVPKVTVSAPVGEDIFVAGKAPKYSAGEILASLKITPHETHSAYIDVTVEFYTDYPTNSLTKSMTTRIYITCEGVI